MAGSNQATMRYPTIIFYGSKAIQFVLSVVVGATWSYVFFQLMNSHQDVPKTFFFLAAIAFVSIIILTTTTFVVWFSGPQSPFGMVLVSLVLTVMWIGNIVALSQHVGSTLSTSCNLVAGNDGTGVAICNLCKALFGLTIVALVSFVTSLALDLYTLAKSNFGDVSHVPSTKEQELSAEEV